MRVHHRDVHVVSYVGFDLPHKRVHVTAIHDAVAGDEIQVVAMTLTVQRMAVTVLHQANFDAAEPGVLPDGVQKFLRVPLKRIVEEEVERALHSSSDGTMLRHTFGTDVSEFQRGSFDAILAAMLLDDSAFFRALRPVMPAAHCLCVRQFVQTTMRSGNGVVASEENFLAVVRVNSP